MRNLLILIIFISAFSCQKSLINDIKEKGLRKAESYSEFTCLNKTVDKPVYLKDIRAKMYGQWQLKGIVSMIPTKEVADFKIIFKEQINSKLELAEIYLDGVLKYSVKFELFQNQDGNYYSVGLKPEKEKFENGDYNFLRGTIRICDDELFIDNGIAFDAPGYLYRKL